MTIGERLKMRLEELGLKQNELAKRLKISPSTLNGYFTDYREPDVNMLIRLAEELEITVEYITTGKQPSISSSTLSDELTVDSISNLKNIGEKVRQARGNLSLREFAQKCDLSHTHLDSIEKGYDPRTGKPVSLTLETIQKLSKGTGYSVNELLGSDPTSSDSSKEENIDMADNLEEILKYLEREPEGLMYFNEPMSDETREILISNIKHTIELGKKFAKSGLPTSKQKIDEIWAKVDRS